METLEELMKQKKEIEERIKLLKSQSRKEVGEGLVIFDKQHFPTSRPDEYYISVNVTPPEGYGNNLRYQERGINVKIIRANTPEKVRQQLESVIEALVVMRKRLSDVQSEEV